MKKQRHLIVGLFIGISALGFIARLWRLNAPLADWHSWRQADTAAVARNFENFGIDVLRPRYDDLSNIQSGRDNPLGWRMVEMPLYQLAGVVVHAGVPRLSIEASLRLISAFSSSVSIFLLSLLILEFVGFTAAVAGAILYAFLPYAVYYGRTILPDSFAIFWVFTSFLLLTIRSKRFSWVFTVLSGVCAAISLLIRPMAGFLLFPSLFLIFRRDGRSFRSFIGVLAYWIIGLFPLLWWRQWILQFPEGIPASNWLFNKDGIRYKGAWFHWIFAKRLGELILGFWGLIPFGAGLVARSKLPDAFLSLLFGLGGLFYVIIFAGGNVQHDYYQAILIPVIVWFAAKGINVLWQSHDAFWLWGSRILTGVILVLSFAFSWYTVRTYYWINRPEIVEAGRVANELLPKNAKVIASYNGDTTFLYQTKRQGWPLGFEIEKKIAQGATHYVTVSPTDADGETRALASEYTVIIRNDKFAIIDLTKPRH